MMAAAPSVQSGIRDPVPDRIYVHQLHLTSADVDRRRRERRMVEEEARKAKERREIRRRQREEEKRRDMEMLLSYNPWGKPGAGAKPVPEKRTEAVQQSGGEEEDEDFIRRFGRPGHGAPNRTLSGRVRTQLAGDPVIRFQDTQDVRLSIENQLRYKRRGDPRSYRRNLDQLIEQKEQLRQEERDWENRKLEEMLEQYPFGRESSGGAASSSYLSHPDPMFMATRPTRIVLKDEDFDPWGKGFGNPTRDERGNVLGHKKKSSVEERSPQQRRRRGGGAGDPHLTESGRHRTRLRNTLRNLKSMGPHIDDSSYDPWGRPGGGAPFVRKDDGRVLEEKLGWSMTGHPGRRTRDAKDEYRNELERGIRDRDERRQEERLKIQEPSSDVASFIRRGAGGRPRRDPATGELTSNPRMLTDVTRERLDIRRVRSQDSLVYRGALSEQAARAQEERRRREADDRERSAEHVSTWTSFWGRPGHGAPKDPANHRKENLHRLLDPPTGQSEHEFGAPPFPVAAEV